jgi:hypothetical protein
MGNYCLGPESGRWFWKKERGRQAQPRYQRVEEPYEAAGEARRGALLKL